MSAFVYLQDESFDALVGALEALVNSDRAAPVGGWEIRLTLGGYGVLPEGAASGPELVDDLVAKLRSISAPRRSALQAA